MTLASEYVSTPPFCGACGWDVSRSNVGNADQCDACGAQLTAFGFDALDAPVVTATTGDLKVVVAFTASPLADAVEVSYTIDGGTAVVDSDATSPINVTAANGEVVAARARSREGTAWGPWSSVATETCTPLAPTDLAAVGGDLEVAFTWTENGDTNDFSYTVDGGAATVVSPATSPQTIVAGGGEVLAGKVRAVTDAVEGDYSDEVSDAALPDAPADLAAAGGSLKVDFTWTTDDEDSIDISYNIDGGTEVEDLGVTSPYTVVAAAGETVTGKIRAVQAGVNGAWTATANDLATA